MQISDALALSTTLLEVSDSPKKDLELILCHILEKPPSYLMTWPEKALSSDQLERFQACLSRRTKGEPVAYILGYRGFWTLDLEVTPDTLIPRADTEVLIEIALARFDQSPRRVADLGTGTGAIALALASERPSWDIWGCDRIPAAVALAKRNQARYQLLNVSFVEGDWLSPLDGQFDLIVSNPPYIDSQDCHLQQGDVRFEPLSALVADEHGLADIKLIATQALPFLKPEGCLMFEHGYNQGEAVRQLLAMLGYHQIETHQDYGGNDRITLGCNKGLR